MVVYSYNVSGGPMLFKFDRYSILLLIEVTGVFCLFKCSKHFEKPNIHFKKLVTAIATCSYGMYLTHCMFIHILGKLIPIDFLGFYGTYLVLITGAFFGSLLLIYGLGKVPIVNEYIGIK